jgi:E3 ubiquitin-protein ligase UBR1
MITSPNPIVAYHTASMFHQIDVGVTLRPAMDTFREEMVGVIITWLADMCKATLLGDDEVFRRTLWQVLNSPRTTTTTNGTPPPKDLRIFPSNAKRIDWLMRIDVRLWKRAKFELRQIYSSLYCLDFSVSSELACRFASNYVRLFEHYLFIDRDPDTNLIYTIAYIGLGSGDIAAHAVEHAGFLSTVLDTAEAWYTNQVEDSRLVVPLMDQQIRLDIDNVAFRGKKGTSAISHLRALFRHPEIQKLVLTNPQLFNRTLSFFNVFVGMQTQKREQGEHIEYEVEWQKCFVILAELGKCCREFGEMMRWATTSQIMSCLAVVANRILCDMMLMSPTLDPPRYHRPVEWIATGILIPGSSYNLIQNNVARVEAFSFHHYLNWVFAEMCKWLPNTWGGGNLIKEFESSILRTPNHADAERMKLLLIEYPLQSEYSSSRQALMCRTCHRLANTRGHVEEEWSGYARSNSSLSGFK